MYFEQYAKRSCSLDVAAYPNNVNDLPGVQNDVRTVEKLVDGVHNTQDGAHMWLAPILPGEHLES